MQLLNVLVRMVRAN